MQSLLANTSFFAKMKSEQLAEAEPMSNPGYQQSDVVKNFLRVSRRYFDLGPDRSDFPGLKKRVGRAVLQSLLIAGSLGGTLGAVAHADFLPDDSTEACGKRGAKFRPASSSSG
ncbi:MAG: hypothetical protein HT580_11595 [Dechloromonas sp.]|nr:MAG: hypothetical protein HT580_11595 [Dechloromonas sp.]